MGKHFIKEKTFTAKYYRGWSDLLIHAASTPLKKVHEMVDLMASMYLCRSIIRTPSISKRLLNWLLLGFLKNDHRFLILDAFSDICIDLDRTTNIGGRKE